MAEFGNLPASTGRKVNIKKETKKIISDSKIPEKFRDKIAVSILRKSIIDDDNNIVIDKTIRELNKEQIIEYSDNYDLSKYDKKHLKAVFSILHKQKNYDKENNVTGFKIVDKLEKDKFNFFKLSSLKEKRIAGVIHIDSSFNWHNEIGAIVFDNKICYISDGIEYTKIIKGKRKFFHRDGSYEEFFICYDFLPFTLDLPLELLNFPENFKNMLLGVCYTVKMTSNELMLNSIASMGKVSGREKIVLILLGIALGSIIGIVFF